jgi:hypothetical protein
LSEDVLDIIRNILVKKYDDVQIYKLNPSINDLINNNLYKLFVNNQLFLVPLWQNESYFDSSGCEIIVICEPELPKGVTIDDESNVYINLILNNSLIGNMIINELPIDFSIGDKIFSIPISELNMKREQFYRIKNKGLSKEKDDIYDISERADVIVKIIPYLVAMLVAIRVFRDSGAMVYVLNGITYLIQLTGINTEFVGALPVPYS